MDAFTLFLVEKAKNDWLVNLNADDWSYSAQTKGQGLTIESLYIAEMLTYLLKNQELSDKV